MKIYKPLRLFGRLDLSNMGISVLCRLWNVMFKCHQLASSWLGWADWGQCCWPCVAHCDRNPYHWDKKIQLSSPAPPPVFPKTEKIHVWGTPITPMWHLLESSVQWFCGANLYPGMFGGGSTRFGRRVLEAQEGHGIGAWVQQVPHLLNHSLSKPHTNSGMIL